MMQVDGDDPNCAGKPATRGVEAFELPFLGERQEVAPQAEVRPHAHDRPQVGIPLAHPLTVMTERQAILVPPTSAVWMPAGVVHHCRSAYQVDVRNVALHPSAAAAGPTRACVLRTTPFVRELVCHMSSLDGAQCDSLYARHLLEVLLAEMRPSDLPQIEMRMPRDRRLQRVARAVLEDPMDERSLRDWSDVVGASYRTLARRFLQETAQCFHDWRETVRLLEGVRLLAAGHSVAHTAASLGYCSAAGFTAMFKRRIGVTPSDYQRGLASP